MTGKRLIRGAVARLGVEFGIRRRIRGWRTLVKNASRCDQAARICEPGGGRIVVLAPHMDDEVLGCGGTLARHIKAGAEVTVIYLTDGRHGSAANAALSEPERAIRQGELVETRKQEARQAALHLGIQNLVFLEIEDQQLHADKRAPGRLREHLRRIEPDVVYLPFFLERHPDHRAANDVLVAAAAGTALAFECRGYEVWTPLFPNCVVKIDDTVELKKRALGCYTSQLLDMDYLRIGIGLNAYRASAMGSHAGSFAEAFHALDLGEYRRFHRAVCGVA